MSRAKLPTFGRKLLRRAFCTRPKPSPLNDFHADNGGKMVDFGGFLLPVQYADMGIAASHLHTRKRASLFDVSHMMQTEVTGRDCVQYFETMCTADLVGLRDNCCTLTVFTNENGGILDDLIVTKILNDHLYVVSNAARRTHDQTHMLNALDAFRRANPTTDVKVRFFEPAERALLALQGPLAAAALQKLTRTDLARLYFMTSTAGDVAGVTCCRITRCGYTGEDGFEISLPSIKVEDVAREILNLNADDVRLAGLGARDSLRLEAGLCLYGSDITERTTPVEAGLAWAVARRRRDAGGFPGAHEIARQLKDGPARKRVGLVFTGGPPARQGAAIFDESGQRELGAVTSGGPGPTVDANVAMGYVPVEFSKSGTSLKLRVRERLYDARVTKMPFVQTKYYTAPK